MTMKEARDEIDELVDWQLTPRSPQYHCWTCNFKWYAGTEQTNCRNCNGKNVRIIEGTAP